MFNGPFGMMVTDEPEVAKEVLRGLFEMMSNAQNASRDDCTRCCNNCDATKEDCYKYQKAQKSDYDSARDNLREKQNQYFKAKKEFDEARTRMHDAIDKKKNGE